jgi:hypothetical protein
MNGTRDGQAPHAVLGHRLGSDSLPCVGRWRSLFNRQAARSIARGVVVLWRVELGERLVS